MKLNSLFAGAGLKVPSECRDCEILGVTCDSRQVKQNFIFVATKGTKVDGTSFISDAVERGAAAIVTDNPAVRIPKHNGKGQKRDICNAHVDDAHLALALLSSSFYGRPSDSMHVTGITGTNGKTTVAYMVRDVLKAAGKQPGLIGTVEYEIGSRQIPSFQTTPDAPVLQSMLSQMLGAGCKSVVMEVSSHSLDQKRVAGIDFDAAVFTNLTGDHLDYHGTIEKYFEVKKKLFMDLGRDRKKAVAVINIDDSRGREIARMALKATVLTCGISEDADVVAEDVRSDVSGSHFSIKSPWGQADIDSRLMGEFNIRNTLAAFAVCGAAGVEIPVMARVLSGINNVRGRLERVETDKGFSVFVDYAHTDDALKNVLSTLRRLTEKRLIVVFGCGGDRDKTKRPLMGKTAITMADHVVLTSDNPRTESPSSIMSEIRSGFGDRANFSEIEDRREAIKEALSMAKKGDVVLIAGKGHERFQEFANKKISFDDRAVVSEFI